MDPDATLTELRELYNDLQDGRLLAPDGERAVELFDALDNWLMDGGFLPRAWRR